MRIDSTATIANPIYDSAFKYLLDDERIARIFLSALIGSEILELDFRPTEVHHKLPKASLTVFRMDFAARVRTEDGSEKMILIEIQKAKLAEDVMRFRRYLGHQYASADNVVREAEDVFGKPGKPLEIFTIYFLGHTLQHTPEPVVWVRRELYGLDGDRNQRIDGVREEFIDALTHDSIIVQIPYLKHRRRTDLERLLSIFDQSQQVPGDLHVLNLETEGMPERYAEVVRRLVKAAATPAVQVEMDLEDEFLRGLEDKEREVAAALQREKEAITREEKERKLKEEALAELEKLRSLLEGKAER